MRYTFNQGTDGNLNDAGNWNPTGGPPGAGDDAIFFLGSTPETLTGSAAVDGAEFTHRGSSLGDEIPFTLENVTFSATSLLVEQVAVFEDRGSMNAEAMQVSAGSFNILGGATLQTNHVLLKPVGDDRDSGVYAQLGGTWTNTGDVVFGPDPYQSAGSTIAAVDGGTVTIGGNVVGGLEPPFDAHLDAQGGLLSVAGNVNIAAGAEISAYLGGSIVVAGDMLVNAQQSPDGEYVGASILAQGDDYTGSWLVSTIDVGHNLVLGAGALLEPNAGLISVGNKLALLDGSTAIMSGGTIDAPTIVLSGAAFLTAGPAVEASAPGQNTIAGVDGGATTVFNGAAIDVNNTLTVNGDVRGHGMLMVGDPGSTGTVEMAVNGTLAGQDVQFGAPLATLYADHFGPDLVEHFRSGDIIASPGIQHSL